MVVAGLSSLGSLRIWPAVAPYSMCQIISIQFQTIRGFVWSATGFGVRTNTLPAIHRWCSSTGEISSVEFTCVCWWYTNLRFFVSHHPSDIDALQERMSVCIDDVIFWMMANRLQINPAKTEVLWCSSACLQHQMATHLCWHCPSFVTLTLTWVWEPTSLQPSGPVLQHCDRFAVYAIHWRRMLCWLCSAHWSSPSLISAVQRWMVCLEHCCSDYSLCWTPLLDYQTRRGDRNTQLLSGNFTSWKFRR